jgi:hypothetical protein
MKKLTIIMAVLFALSLSFSAWVMHVGMEHTDDVNALAGANFRLANQLLFDGLQRNTIDIYVWHTNTPRAYQRNGYTIRVIPLSGDDTELTLGNSNFLEHNDGCVFMHACHIWDEDRELALFLLELLSKVHPSARDLLSKTGPDGSLTPEGKKTVEGQAWAYGLRLNTYGVTVPKNIEQEN